MVEHPDLADEFNCIDRKSSVRNTESPIEIGKSVVFFPTCGHLDTQSRQWVLPIHGWIYEPGRSTNVGKATLAIFRRYLRFKTKEPLTPLFRERIRAFTVKNQRGKRISVQLGSRVFPLEKSGSNGHFKGVVRLSIREVERLFQTEADSQGWLPYMAVTRNSDPRNFVGKVQLIPETGYSVISDIDDTIKHSAVRNRKELLANTFLRDFRAVPSVADVYRNWGAAGARFHYVSSSPWQLYEPLVDFLEKEGFPEGTLHLKVFRLRDSRLWRRIGVKHESKSKAIETILQCFPQRKFVLVGDSGERDPEIYGAVARNHPLQVVRIWIRDVTGHSAASPRYKKAFRGAPEEKWTLFRTIGELRAESSAWTPADLLQPVSR